MREEELMLTTLLDCERLDLYVDPKPLTPSQRNRFDEMKARRAKGEPLQYILGCCHFFGINLKVDQRVLIPRPETELLVEAVIKKSQLFVDRPIQILDLGTGSGNIAIALAKNIPAANIATVDISSDALALAKENALAHKVTSQVRFIQADLFSQLNFNQNQFDFIVSNPPYISSAQIHQLPKDVQQEPCIALDGGIDGLDFYRRIISQGRFYLKQGGCLFLEIGDGQKQDIMKMLQEAQYDQRVEWINDYSQTPRIVMAEVKNG